MTVFKVPNALKPDGARRGRNHFQIGTRGVSAMKEDDTRHTFHLKRRLYARFMKAQGKVASVSKNSISFFIVPSEGALRGGTGHVIQRGINARDNKEEADDQ